MDILSIILANTAAVAILGFLFKVWIEKRLTHSLSLDLEKFRASLSKEVARDSIKEQWNHQKRMELFSELNELMVKLELHLKTFYMTISVAPPDRIKEASNNVCDGYLNINSVIHKNELFLEDKIIHEIQDSYKPLFEFAMYYVETGKSEKGEDFKTSFAQTMTLGESPRKKVLKVFKGFSGINA